MAKIKLWFVDTYDNAKFFFTDILSRRHEVVLDENDPDYLFFGDRNFGVEHLNVKWAHAKKIFFTGENVRPYWNECQYAISFDHINSPNHYRLPLYVLEMWAINKDNNPLGVYDYDYLVKHRPVNNFRDRYFELAYIQSNPRCEYRNQIIQKFKDNGKLRSAGPVDNTVGYLIPRDRSLKFQFYSECVFGAALENGSYPGYVTEKLIDCYYAGVVPIYWGSPTITRDFNPNSFIQATTPQETYDRVISMSDRQISDILHESPFNNNCLPDVAQLENFQDWFDRFVL